MLETVAHPIPTLLDGTYQIGSDQLVERWLRVLRGFREGKEEGLVEFHAEYGRLLQQTLLSRRQLVDARDEQPLERGRNIGRVACRRHGPPPVSPCEGALAHQAADYLLHEQGIAARARRDELLQRLEVVALHRAEQCTDEGLGVRFGQGRHPHPRRRSPLHRRRVGLGAMGQEHHQRTIGQFVDHAPEEVHGGGVGPLEIVDHDDEGALLHALVDECLRGERNLPMELRGLELAGPRFTQAEKIAEDRRDGLLDILGSELRQAGGKLLPGYGE
jgi:hypothetical protein